VNEIFLEMWEENCKILKKELEDNKKRGGDTIQNLYAYLYWRFGREAGK